MIAADEIARLIGDENATSRTCETYEKVFKTSWVFRELYKVRNIRPAFHWGLWAGMIHAAFQTIGGWRLP